MILRCIGIFVIFSFFACAKTKTVKFYDEAKVEKNEIATIIIPNDIDLSKVNTEFVNTPITNKEYELQLSKGHHTLTARYYCLWSSNSGENILLKSAKVKINIELEAGKTYRIGHKALSNFTEASAFENSPQFNINEMKSLNASETNSPPNNNDKKSLDVLKLIWENTSDEERRKFLEWLKEKN